MNKNIPTVTLKAFDHLDPELRERVLERIRSRITEPSYRLLSPERLRALSRIQGGEQPIVSVYLRLTPERKGGGAWRTLLNSLAKERERAITDRRLRKALERELERIEKTLEAELPELGQGVAFFVCEPLGVWHMFSLSVPLEDRVWVGERPYLRPLLRTLDEHERFVIALLSQEHSRFFISTIGQVEEVFQVRGQQLRRLLTDRTPSDQLDAVLTQERKDEAKALAWISELIMRQFEGRHLLLAAPGDLRHAVLGSMSPQLKDRLAGEVSVPLEASTREVAEAVEPLQRQVEAREEQATVQALIEAGPDQAAWGEQPVFEALHQGRVRLLVVDDSRPALAGGRCQACGALFCEATSPCPLCGGEVVAESELVERALERALEQDASLELIRSEAGLALMADRGSMAALLRW